MKNDLLLLCRNKIYGWMLCLTAVCGYGFLVTHQTVGIDDTPYAYYFEEGLNAIVGRWFLFLLGKVFHISDFSPFITDFAGVLILMAAVTVWCALLHSICGDRISVWGYVFFSCIFLSSPLISEVYTYYLHNGISVGYLCVGISLCFFRDLTVETGGVRQIIARIPGVAAFLVIALGCYESFMVVWLLGVFLVLLTENYMGVKTGTFASLLWGALAAVAAILLRSLVIAGVIGVFGLGEMRGEAVQRSILEMAGWMLEPGAWAEFAMVLKRIYVMYGVFAYAYYPIKIFVTASLLIGVSGIYFAFRRRNVRIFLLTLGSFGVSFLLVIVEGKATLYRSAQFLPVICGYGAFLAAYAAEGLIKGKLFSRAPKLCGGLAGFAGIVVLWNQCFDLNRWFYVDWLKYESAVELAGRIADKLEQNYDISKPVVFTGTYQAPRGIIGDAYVGYGTEVYHKMKRWTDMVDEHLLDKFYREYGVWVAQTPALSVVDWGINAFGTDEELVRFFAMHGYSIRANTDSERFEAALLYSMDFPGFPQEGAIVDMGEYIIVHF